MLTQPIVTADKFYILNFMQIDIADQQSFRHDTQNTLSKDAYVG